MRQISDKEGRKWLEQLTSQKKVEFFDAFPDMTAAQAASVHSKITLAFKIAVEGIPVGPIRAQVVTAHPMAKPRPMLTAGHKKTPKKKKYVSALMFTPKTTEFKDMSQPEAIQKVLAREPKLDTTEVTQRLGDNGYPFTSKNPVGSVTVALGALRRQGLLQASSVKKKDSNIHIYQWELSKAKFRVAKV